MKVLDRKSSAVFRVASTDSARPSLNKVLVEVDGRTVATDGHRLLTVAGAPGSLAWDKVPGALAPTEPDTAPSLVDAKLLGKAFTGRAAVTVVHGSKVSTVGKVSAGGRYSFEPPVTHEGAAELAESGSTKRTSPVYREAGQYPNWRQVTVGKREGKRAAVLVNAEYLRDLAQAAIDAADDSGVPAVALTWGGALGPVRSTWHAGDGRFGLGLLMPLRTVEVAGNELDAAALEASALLGLVEGAPQVKALEAPADVEPAAAEAA